MSKNFNTSNETFRKIMGNGLTHVVPKFQRDYSWESEQWEDLWQDIVGQIEEKESEGQSHYMGYLVLQTDNNKEYKVIDGQQRLATLMILILSVLHRLQKLIESHPDLDMKKRDEQRLDTLKNTYIGFTDPISLVTKPKLTLNKNNKLCFESLCTLVDKPKPKNYSSKLLLKAYEFFIKKITESNYSKDGEALASFVDKMSDVLFFTTITVNNDLNAYTVFETLNARGVKLSTPDLIKNHLFSMIDEKGQLASSEEENLENKWGQIIQTLEKSDFSQFIRVHWNSKHSATSSNQLFRKIKQSITGKSELFTYIRDLDDTAEIFAALSSDRNHEEDFWSGQDFKEARNYLKTLRIFNIEQPYVLLIAAYKNFNHEEFCKILGYIDVISIRNVIGQRQTNQQEGVYNQTALEISNKSITNLSGIKQRLKTIYPNDEDFIHDFIKREIKTERTHKKARYILARIERFLNPEFSGDESDFTLEHILPKNPDQGWNGYEEDDFEILGNMTLLDKKTNKMLGNQLFSEKKKIFLQSALKITKQVCEVDVWGGDEIKKRQRWLAEQATKCWKIEF